jgi:uncharacterized protein (DUF779 family)
MDSQLHVDRVTATPAALTALARLCQQRGSVILYQVSGRRDGSSPICFGQGDLLIGDGDVLLGRVGDCPVYFDGRMYEIWKHTQLIIDVAEGAPEAFSLPAGDDEHFVTRFRVFSPRELAALPRAEEGEPRAA